MPPIHSWSAQRTNDSAFVSKKGPHSGPYATTSLLSLPVQFGEEPAKGQCETGQHQTAVQRVVFA